MLNEKLMICINLRESIIIFNFAITINGICLGLAI